MLIVTRRRKSSTERTRLFRERNPGYEARRKAARRAAEKQSCEQFLLRMQAEHAEQVAAERRGPLLLPAPVESLDLQLLEAAMKQREAVGVAVGQQG